MDLSLKPAAGCSGFKRHAMNRHGIVTSTINWQLSSAFQLAIPREKAVATSLKSLSHSAWLKISTSTGSMFLATSLQLALLFRSMKATNTSTSTSPTSFRDLIPQSELVAKCRYAVRRNFVQSALWHAAPLEEPATYGGRPSDPSGTRLMTMRRDQY